MEWYTLLKFAHILGTVLGVGATTLAEIFTIKFAKSDDLSPTEHYILQTCYSVIRWGLALLIFSGFGYLIIWRLNMAGPELFFNSRFIAKITIVGILLFFTLLMNLKMIRMELGSAIAITSWYMAMFLGIWRSLQWSYLVFIAFYVSALIVIYFLLDYLRKRPARERT